ncbi:hypothetical protein DUNSADRAFT_13145 [Dunaliella salina]|uniref:PPM-type phosphatase domain-containing protein n=1 Tax=Dunaliella salina TaxID=3046 RepID=A0ABQ7GA12_DUNSA|nr:hypothetical protein DUNSADRAFT_13145 [Dunaliella salina]|eukprot:KAF5831437.1 hypothetical protein DUNSADRAFT_13145 [Dunaliella salina]
MGTAVQGVETGSRYVNLPHTHHATASRVVKGEDVLVVHPLSIFPPGSAMMYMGPAKPGEPGVGPLRIWPGGLCVARSIGDLDAGPEIVPVPHIRQVMMPPQGCRLILASDGLWDLMSYSKAVTMTRAKPTSAATAALIQVVSRDLRVMDDASIVVVDMLPNERTSFPTVALRSNPGGTKKKSKSGGLFSCFKPETEEPDSRDATGVGHLQFLSNVDCLLEYPGLRNMLNRTSLNKSTARRISEARHSQTGPVDFTLHGGKRGKAEHASPNCVPLLYPSCSLAGSKTDPVSPRHCSSAENTVHAELPSHPASTAKGLTPLEQALQGENSALSTPSPDSSEQLSGSNAGGSSRGGKSRFLYQQYQQQQQQQQQQRSSSLQGQLWSPSSLEDVAEDEPGGASQPAHVNRMQYRVVKKVEVEAGGLPGGKAIRTVELAGGGGVEQIGEQQLGTSGPSAHASQGGHQSRSSRPPTGDSVLSEGEVTVHEGQGALAALQQKQQQEIQQQ